MADQTVPKRKRRTEDIDLPRSPRKRILPHTRYTAADFEVRALDDWDYDEYRRQLDEETQRRRKRYLALTSAPDLDEVAQPIVPPGTRRQESLPPPEPPR